MEIADGHAVMSYGLRNFPDGEIFTSPNANSTEGEIFVDLTVNYGGNDIFGIYLRFKAGQIVDYSADVGQEHLEAIIETGGSPVDDRTVAWLLDHPLDTPFESASMRFTRVPPRSPSSLRAAPWPVPWRRR